MNISAQARSILIPDLFNDPNTLFAVHRLAGVTLETGVKDWLDPLRPTLGYTQATLADQPAYTNEWVIGDASNYMSLNPATIAALNAYGGDDITIVVVQEGDTASPANYVAYEGLAEGVGVNHTFNIFRVNSGLDLLSQCRRNTSATTKAASITIDETTAVDVYASVMPRNTLMELHRGATVSATVDTVEDLALPTDFAAAHSHMFAWTATAGILRYTGRRAAALYYKGALSAAQLADFKTNLQELGII